MRPYRATCTGPAAGHRGGGTACDGSVCHSALEVSDYGRHRDVLLFVDPPYLSGIRTSVNYRHEMAAEADHRELAGALHRPGRASSCPVTTATCTASCTGWHRAEVATANRPGPRGALALRLGRRARAWRGQRPGPKWPARRKPGLPQGVARHTTDHSACPATVAASRPAGHCDRTGDRPTRRWRGRTT